MVSRWNSTTKTYKVVVVSDSGNKYRFRNSTDTATFGSSAVTLDLQEGGTYTFDVSDNTMSSHPFVIGTGANRTEYSTGVTYKLDGVTKTYSQYTSGFWKCNNKTINYYCACFSQHYIIGVVNIVVWGINTNTTFGSSNFDGSIQSTVSVNSTAGFYCVLHRHGSGSGTIEHDLGATPDVTIMIKNRCVVQLWLVLLSSNLLEFNSNNLYLHTNSFGEVTS